MPILTITNFQGRLTRYEKGDINSGLAKYTTTFGNDPFSEPGNLTWLETATRIDPNETVITDLIVAGKERVESGISYVYAIGHLGRLYKIQVNDPSTNNPNYDNPVLLATLTSGSPTFKRGGSIEFFGSTERIYIGHDKGVTRINFDGTSETAVSGTWTQDVPRPVVNFLGKLYHGNGTNISEIDSTATQTFATKLTPAFPVNTQVRDIDLSPDGTYIEIVVSRLALPDITLTTQDTTFLSNSESYSFKWNGIDTGYTAFDVFPAFSMNANHVFGPYKYLWGYDLTGGVLFQNNEKILSVFGTEAPLPNAVGSNGNIVGWFASEYKSNKLQVSLFLYGSLDNEVQIGWWRQLQQAAQGTETDVLKIPFYLIVSNFGRGGSANGYAGNVFASGKLYFSTLETSSAPTTKYKLYKFFPVVTTVGTTIPGVYETQTQLFSEKIAIKEVRVYTKPLVANNEFKIDLIGSDAAVITNSTKTFTVGSTATAGNDLERYAPDINQTYALGVRITNSGTVNMTFKKIEILYEFVS